MVSPGNIKILVAFEHTGSIASEFHKKGFNVTSCDLKPQNCPWYHVEGNVFDLLSLDFDFLFAFYPCTFLAKAQTGLVLNSKNRYLSMLNAVAEVKRIFNSSIPRIAMENPVGLLSRMYRKPDQIVYPWYFGDPYRKEICLWFKNCPPVLATCYNPVRKSISNHVNSRMSQAEKSEIRSSWKFYPRMSEALVHQYSSWLLKDIK